MILIKSLSYDANKVREGAAYVLGEFALGEFAAETELAVPALVIALEDSVAKRPAAVALAKMGPKAEQAVPALKEALSDPDEGMAALARYALWKIDPTHYPAKEAVPAFMKLIKDGPKLGSNQFVWGYNAVEVAREAAKALGKIGPNAKEAVPVLKQAMEIKSLRKAAAEALKKIESEAGNTEREP